MTRLLELQRAVYRSLVEGDDGPAAAHVVTDGIAGAARLGVYRNTFIGSLTAALRLVYPGDLPAGRRAVLRARGAPTSR